MRPQARDPTATAQFLFRALAEFYGCARSAPYEFKPEFVPIEV